MGVKMMASVLVGLMAIDLSTERLCVNREPGFREGRDILYVQGELLGDLQAPGHDGSVGGSPPLSQPAPAVRFAKYE